MAEEWHPPADDEWEETCPMDNGMGMPPAGDEGNETKMFLMLDDLTNASERNEQQGQYHRKVSWKDRPENIRRFMRY